LQGLQERLTEAEEALQSSIQTAKEMEEAFQQASKEVGEVKQRARALLEEKDAQLQAARVWTPPPINHQEMGRAHLVSALMFQ